VSTMITGFRGCAASVATTNHDNTKVTKAHEENRLFFVLLRARRVFVVTVTASTAA